MDLDSALAEIAEEVDAEIAEEVDYSVSRLPHVSLAELAADSGGRIVLQRVDGGCMGESLRVTEFGGIDFCGGLSWNTIFTAHVISAWPTLQVRFEHQPFNYLRYLPGGRLDIHGPYDTDCIFEVLPRDAPAPWVSIAPKGVPCVIGTFMLRRAPCKWWHPQLMASVRELLDVDVEFTGRRRHPKDPTRRYFTFQEWVDYADSVWLSGRAPGPEMAMLLAKEVWRTELVVEPEQLEDVSMYHVVSMYDGDGAAVGWVDVMAPPMDESQPMTQHGHFRS